MMTESELRERAARISSFIRKPRNHTLCSSMWWYLEGQMAMLMEIASDSHLIELSKALGMVSDWYGVAARRARDTELDDAFGGIKI